MWTIRALYIKLNRCSDVIRIYNVNLVHAIHIVSVVEFIPVAERYKASTVVICVSCCRFVRFWPVVFSSIFIANLVFTYSHTHVRSIYTRCIESHSLGSSLSQIALYNFIDTHLTARILPVFALCQCLAAIEYLDFVQKI